MFNTYLIVGYLCLESIMANDTYKFFSYSMYLVTPMGMCATKAESQIYLSMLFI